MTMATLKSLFTDMESIYVLHDGNNVAVEAVLMSYEDRARISVLIQDVKLPMFMRERQQYKIERKSALKGLASLKSSPINSVSCSALLTAWASSLEESDEVVGGPLYQTNLECDTAPIGFSVQDMEIADGMKLYLSADRRNLQSVWCVDILGGCFLIASDGHVLCARRVGEQRGSVVGVNSRVLDLCGRKSVELWDLHCFDTRYVPRAEFQHCLTSEGALDSSVFLYEDGSKGQPPAFDAVIKSAVVPDVVTLPADAFWMSFDDLPDIGDSRNTPLVTTCILPSDTDTHRCVMIASHEGVVLSITETEVATRGWFKEDTCYVQFTGRDLLGNILKRSRSRASLGDIRSYSVQIGSTSGKDLGKHDKLSVELPFSVSVLAGPVVFRSPYEVGDEIILVMGRSFSSGWEEALLTTLG